MPTPPVPGGVDAATIVSTAPGRSVVFQRKNNPQRGKLDREGTGMHQRRFTRCRLPHLEVCASERRENSEPDQDCDATGSIRVRLRSIEGLCIGLPCPPHAERAPRGKQAGEQLSPNNDEQHYPHERR